MHADLHAESGPSWQLESRTPSLSTYAQEGRQFSPLMRQATGF
jgi:hypothetical protein